MVNITHFRPSSEAEVIMAPLLALNPVQNIKKTVEWGSITDSSDAFSKHGGLNTIVSCGLQRFDGKQFIVSLERWKKMVDEAPRAKRSLFMFTWFSNQNEMFKRIVDESSAWSHRDCAVWL
jgi:hypothetical protein